MIWSGRICGLVFQVNVPRSLQIAAVWVAKENRLLFYDSTGVRFAETQLAKSPDLKKVAA